MNVRATADITHKNFKAAKIVILENPGLESMAGTGRLQIREVHNFIPVKNLTKQFLGEMGH